MTNAEKIRIMTNDELADWFLNGEKICVPSPKRCTSYTSCIECVQDWLNQEAKE